MADSFIGGVAEYFFRRRVEGFDDPIAVDGYDAIGGILEYRPVQLIV